MTLVGVQYTDDKRGIISRRNGMLSFSKGQHAVSFCVSDFYLIGTTEIIDSLIVQ